MKIIMATDWRTFLLRHNGPLSDAIRISIHLKSQNGRGSLVGELM